MEGGRTSGADRRGPGRVHGGSNGRLGGGRRTGGERVGRKVRRKKERRTRWWDGRKGEGKRERRLWRRVRTSGKVRVYGEGSVVGESTEGAWAVREYMDAAQTKYLPCPRFFSI